jgi:ribosomal protein S18 acetylase RimI-like enzyme
MARILGPYLAKAIVLQGLLNDYHPNDSHYYLQTIGVRPGLQGKGTGSALLTAALERCDDEHLGAYLEASNERSRRLYERHNFTIRDEIRLPDGPTIWAMWRNPSDRSQTGSKP